MDTMNVHTRTNSAQVRICAFCAHWQHCAHTCTQPYKGCAMCACVQPKEVNH